jgi:hypothetical protein
MRNFLLTAAAIVCLLPPVIAGKPGAPQPGTLAALDAQYGFRDLKFEQSVKSCGDLALLEDSGEMKFYARKGDRLELGGVKLKAIEYGFYKGKLASVTLNVADDADPAVLFKHLEGEYGPAQASPSKAGKYYWFGEKVLMDFWSGGVGRGTVGMWSKPLQKARAAGKP